MRGWSRLVRTGVLKILRGPSQIRGARLTGRLLHRGPVTAPRHLVSPHAHHSQKDLCGFRQLTTISTLMFLGLGGSATGWRAPCARIQMLEAGTPRLTTSRLMYSARACDNCPACCVLASLGSAWTDRATRRKPLSSHTRSCGRGKVRHMSRFAACDLCCLAIAAIPSRCR